jgi:hypothetical protein
MAYAPASAAFEGVVMKAALKIRSLTKVLAVLASTLAAACPPPHYDRAALEALKTSKFEVAADETRQALALTLLPCLAHPDPELRDGIAFEAYSTWLRANRLDAATRTALMARLGIPPAVRGAGAFGSRTH